MTKILFTLITTAVALQTQALTVSAPYSSGDGSVINQVKSDGTLAATDRPNIGAFTTGGFNGFFYFELPTLSSGQTIEGADFSPHHGFAS